MTPLTMQTPFTFAPIALREMHECLPKIDKVTYIMWCQYGIGFLGLCCIVSEEFDYKLKRCFGLQKYNIRDRISYLIRGPLKYDASSFNSRATRAGDSSQMMDALCQPPR